jgi:hypothetical protein
MFLRALRGGSPRACFPKPRQHLRLHDVGPNYLVMELVKGSTLADRYQEGRDSPRQNAEDRAPDR